MSKALICVVTGASRGVGRGVALALGASGATVYVTGRSVKEGDSPLANLVIEQIQQDLTVFSFNGKTFTLAALDDWPGGKIEESPQAE